MRRKTNVGRSVHASGSMCTTDSVLLGHHSFMMKNEMAGFYTITSETELIDMKSSSRC